MKKVLKLRSWVIKILLLLIALSFASFCFTCKNFYFDLLFKLIGMLVIYINYEVLDKYSDLFNM